MRSRRAMRGHPELMGKSSGQLTTTCSLVVGERLVHQLPTNGWSVNSPFAYVLGTPSGRAARCARSLISCVTKRWPSPIRSTSIATASIPCSIRSRRSETSFGICGAGGRWRGARATSQGDRQRHEHRDHSDDRDGGDLAGVRLAEVALAARYWSSVSGRSARSNARGRYPPCPTRLNGCARPVA